MPCCSSAPEFPILSLQVHLGGRVKKCWSWFAFWCQMQIKKMLAIGRKSRDIRPAGTVVTSTWATHATEQGSSGDGCLSRFCTCWLYWQMLPPLPRVGRVPTYCCCSCWGLPVCRYRSDVCSHQVSAGLFLFWHFVRSKSQAYTHEALK